MKTKRRRAESVSVDRRTQRILKRLADRPIGGRTPAIGRDTERRDALAWLIRDAGGSKLTDELRRELDAELRRTTRKT
jgi:hypothetical protein